MKGRRAARSLALTVLYEAEIRADSPIERLRAHGAAGWELPHDTDDDSGAPQAPQLLGPGVLDYVRILVEGVHEHRRRIDALIESHSEHWDIDRMPVIDVMLLRLAVFELLYRADVPVAVVINEAIELGKELSTEDSGRFINGVLGRMAEAERSG